MADTADIDFDSLLDELNELRDYKERWERKRADIALALLEANEAAGRWRVVASRLAGCITP